MPVNEQIRSKLSQLPHTPGIYLMKDRFGTVIYVGKAPDPRRRVSQYFPPSRRQSWDINLKALIEAIHDFDVHTVNSEPERSHPPVHLHALQAGRRRAEFARPAGAARHGLTPGQALLPQPRTTTARQRCVPATPKPAHPPAPCAQLHSQTTALRDPESLGHAPLVKKSQPSASLRIQIYPSNPR